jgi:hypothetical protein
MKEMMIFFIPQIAKNYSVILAEHIITYPGYKLVAIENAKYFSKNL